jgi:DNA helicase-2/ATP-dependent DNA helicase PcrA
MLNDTQQEVVERICKLNNAQKQAVEHTGSPLLIVAGAGTGKTTVITEKISYLLKNNFAKPEEILALTFTDKAAGEMQERIDEKIKLGYVDMQISTFHNFCLKILREYGLEIGLATDFKQITESEAWVLISKNVHQFELEYYRSLGNPNSKIKSLLGHFSKLKDELINPEEYLDFANKMEILEKSDEIEKQRIIELAKAYKKYNELLLKNSMMDFGDLIFYAVKLLKERPNILKKIQERFKYVLVDEFQDVNWSQYELIREIAKTAELTVVGDDDQSIYAFRGSNVSIIMRFKDDFKNAKEIVLNENYRSGQEILDFAYESIKHNNPNRLEEKLKINKKLISKSNTKSEIIYNHFNNITEESEYVVDKILEIKKQNKKLVWDDFAILIRANSHADSFLNALEYHNIPYEFLASSGLYRQKIIIDCISFLRVINDFSDDRSFYRLLRMPFLDFKENDMQKLLMWSKKKSIFYYETLKRSRQFGLSEDGVKISEKIIDLVHDGMKLNKKEKVSQVLHSFLEKSSYLNYLTTEEEKGNAEVIRQIYQLNQFWNLIKKYEELNPEADVSDFIIYYDNLLESGDEGKMFEPVDTPDSVNIITVHSSKGLEYKYVFIVNCVDSRFPIRRKSAGIEVPKELLKENLLSPDFHYEEERRLFYVAVTRAKEKLFFTSASSYSNNEKTKNKISRFLAEMSFVANISTSPKILKASTFLLEQKKKEIEDQKANFIYELPKVFSFSQIKNYRDCPYKYKLANILKIPQKSNSSLSFGNSIHLTLEKFYKEIQKINNVKQDSIFGMPAEIKNVKINNIKIPSLEELFKIYEDNWIEDNYPSKKVREETFLEGKKILKDFYNENSKKWTIPVCLESSFKIKIGEYLLRGKIDRIDLLEDGKLEIIDYKTGKGKEKLATDDKEQLLIYQIAVQTLAEFRNIGELEKLSFYYLNKATKLEFLGKEKDLDREMKKIEDVILNIKDKNFKATPGFSCDYCPYKEICEYKK